MNKKAIAILGAIFLLIVLALGLLIYLRSRKPDTNNQANNEVVIPDQTPTNANTEPEQPTVIKAEKLTDSDVVAPALYFNGQGISYFNQQGQLFTTDLQTSGGKVLLSNKRELTIPQKPNISSVYWAPTGQNFIAEFQGSPNTTWSYFDGAKSAYVNLPTQVQSLDWLGTTGQILFVWKDETGKTYLNSGNPDTSGYTVLTDLYEADNKIAVSPDGKSVLFYRFNNGGTQNSINFVSPDGKVFKTVVKDGYNLGVKWAPDSNKFLFTKRDPSTQKYSLWMGNLASGEVKSLNVETTLEKTAWSKDSQIVYAAGPTKGTAGQSLTEDFLYKITVSSGQSQQYDFGVPADAHNIFPDLTETNIFFKNYQDQLLYYFNIKAATPK